MLTADLVRATVRSGEVKPSFLRKRREEHVARAQELVSLYETSMNRPRAEVEAAVEELVGDDADVQIVRGLAKLLDDRTTWETVAPVDPVELRRRIFEAANAVRLQDRRPEARSFALDRSGILARVAEELGASVESVEGALYADLRGEQRMTSFRTFSAEQLVARYDVALVQSILLHAVELRVDLAVRRSSELRSIFRMVKFHQLMHRVERVSATRWRIVIDGPVSLFRQSQRYGMQIAQFMPWLITLPTWALEADVLWGARKQERTLRITSEDGLTTHRRLRGTWTSREQELLVQRIESKPDGWSVVDEVVVEDLGGEDVLVPDLVLRHDASGRRAYVEIAGFWRRDWLQRRTNALATHGPPNLVLCISKRMATEAADLEGRVPVLPFAEVILWPKLRAIVEEIAR